MKTYCVSWSTDFCERYDTTGSFKIQAANENEAYEKASKLIPYHSVIDCVEEVKDNEIHRC